MSKQSSSMRIAEQLRYLSSVFKTPSHERGICNSAIEELRRLHAENEALKAKIENAESLHSLAVFKAVASERESCACVCDRRAEYGNDAEWCAERIRARG